MSDQRTRHGEPAGDVSLDSKRELGLRATSGRAHRIPKIRGRALEVPAMTAWKRWQDWVVVALGALLFVSPFVFGETAQTVAASSVYFLGVLVALAGVLNAAMRQAGGLEFIPAVLAVILFVSPWAFGFTRDHRSGVVCLDHRNSDCGRPRHSVRDAEPPRDGVNPRPQSRLREEAGPGGLASFYGCWVFHCGYLIGSRIFAGHAVE